MGILAIAANSISSKWAIIIVGAVIAPTIVLLVKDVKKLVLMAFVIDLPLGIDIAIQNQGRHQGGPTGYIVSMMTIALVVGYALWIVEQKPKLQIFPHVTVPALLYLLMVIFSLFQASSLQLGLFGVFLLSQFVLMYFYIVNHVKTVADIQLILNTMVIGLLLESGLMVLQYFTGLTLDIGIVSSVDVAGRVGGTIGDPNSAAIYLAPNLAITLGVYLTDKLVNKRLALGALALGAIALIATSSRSGWMGFLISLAVVFVYAVRTKAGKKAIGMLVLGGLLVVVFFGGQIQGRFGTAQGAAADRGELSYMAYNIIRDYPLGVGENNYDQVMSDKYAHPNWVGHTLYPVHNKYLLVWTDTGLQGLAAFVLLLVATAWQNRQWLFSRQIDSRFTNLAASLLGALACYSFHMFSEGFASRPNVQVLWFIIAMGVATNQLVAQEKRVRRNKNKAIAFSSTRSEFEV
jgi:O-antigen ligase